MPNFCSWFLSKTSEGQTAYQNSLQQSVKLVQQCVQAATGAYSGLSIEQLQAQVKALTFCPEQGVGLQHSLEQTGRFFLENSLQVQRPDSMAHLHCPPLIPALAAEVLLTAMNQSMDSWDQAPVATYLEQQLLDDISQWFYTHQYADGTFTSGGTQSNLMGLLLARDKYCKDKLNHDASTAGLPAQAQRFRILCSEAAHFSCHKSAALLGLGKSAVIPVACDDQYQMSVTALESTIDKLHADSLIPIAIVATAGTTDFASIDPLQEIATLAHRHDCWLHVDAAVGGALILSEHYKHKLAGIEQADSITVDFHKLFMQPVSCGAFLCRDANNLKLLNHHAAYLNPETDGFDALNLVDKSIQTTRRFDALKLILSLQSIGQQGFSNIIEHLLALTKKTAGIIAAEPRFELCAAPRINTVVFRVSGVAGINAKIRQAMFLRGHYSIAQTSLDGLDYLKLTLMNPLATDADIKACLYEILDVADELVGETTCEQA